MMEEKLKVGQTVWILPKGNRARYDKEIRETTITKVGRKWFDVAHTTQYSFSVESGRQKPTEYMDQYFVYFSKEQYETERKEFEDRQRLKTLCDRSTLWDIETVRAVLAILITTP